MTVTRELLNELFYYDMKTGYFIRRTGRARRWKVGQQIMTKCRKGYIRVAINGRKYYVHRLIWLLIYGEWPPSQIDHINGVKDDNRLVNLRVASAQENACNRPARKESFSGHKGVHLDKRTNRWRAKISIKGNRINLGFYSTMEEAITARNNAEIFHGQFSWERCH